MRVEGDITIARPIEDVFDYVADERHEPEYNPQMLRSEKLTPGPIAAGTRFHAVMSGTGVRADMTVEFTEFDRPYRIAEITTMSNMNIRGGLYFEEVAGGTKMSWDWELEPLGFYRYLGPILKLVGDRQERRIWTELKEVLERQPAVQPPIASEPGGD
jgi:polyketide cyclase/dehydrase/lipid transport protein